MEPSKTVDHVVALAMAAGEQILELYRADSLVIEYKDDESPLTAADKKSHQVIVDGLRALSDLPILSEEAADVPWAERRSWSRYWLVDPLDGTKEFIKKNGEFTVNIALIENGKPVFGVVYVPDSETLYYGLEKVGAYKMCGRRGDVAPIHVADVPVERQGWRIMGSRSHQTDEFTAFVEQFDQPEILFWGSSLKLCLVAEGAADLYPRLGLTSEWDTAAGQAVVEAAGGRVINWESRADLRYNAKESLLNPSFIACANPSPIWF